MAQESEKTKPLYDFYEGLGRRRSLKAKGIDPDVLVQKKFDSQVQRKEGKDSSLQFGSSR